MKAWKDGVALIEEVSRWVSGSWIELEDNDSRREMIKDIPVENVHEVIEAGRLALWWEYDLQI